MSYADAAEREGKVITLDDYDHIYENSDMYLGSTVHESQIIWTLTEDLTPRTVSTKTPLGMTQLFNEVLANACDAMEKTVRNGFEIGPIVVDFENPYITIRNEGFPILVRKDENDMWLPEKVVVMPRTGSNFGGHRHGGGKNGYGLTLLYLFCDYLRMISCSSVDGKSFEQEFYGLNEKSEPKVVDYDGETSFVEITFKPNFQRFNYDKETIAYPSEVEDFYRSLLAVASLACKTPVFFNNVAMDYSNIMDYSTIFFPPELKRKVHYVWPKKTKVIKRKDGSQFAADGLTLPLVEMIVVDCESDTVKHFGITNSILNQECGIHVDSVFKALAYPIIAHVNGENKKKKEDGKVAKNLFRVNLGHIKMHMGVIISVRVLNPRFNGQSKTGLRSYEKSGNQCNEMDLELPEEFVQDIIEQFDFVTTLKETVKANVMKPLSDLNGSKSLKCRELNQGDNCRWAGGKHSAECILLIFEGKSAGNYGNWWRAQSPDGINNVGLLATGGKIKNICAITPETVSKLARNKFFQDFKAMTNVHENTDYTIAKNRAKLRYGRILYAGDADVDGVHICGLFFNLIHTLYPSLFEAGIIHTYRTKIVSVLPKTVRGNTSSRKKIFYQLSEYKAWEKTVDISKWNVRYFKGLGSSGKADVEEDYKKMFVVSAVYDEDAENNIRLFFHKEKEYTARRRELILLHNKEDIPPEIPVNKNGNREETISDYLHHNFIGYCAHTLVRHLMARDGLTEVRRKVIHAGIKRWKYWTDVIKNPIGVNIFNGAVLDISKYHHGDSLTGVIIRMSQEFLGTNNVPYFIGEGQFGTRETGPNTHAAARYISILPNYWWLKVMYNLRDDPLLTYKTDDGVIEPEFYLPPLPMTVIMGQTAIMSGWTSYIPPHHVLDVGAWYLERISGKKPSEIKEPFPYFRGFKGRIQITNNRETEEVESSVFDDDGQEVMDDDGNVKKVYSTVTKGKHTLSTYGIVGDIQEDCLTITELPIGISTETFLKKTIPRMQKEGRVKKAERITGHTPDNPVIRVEGVRSRHHKNHAGSIDIDADDFVLRMSYSMASMLILDNDGKTMHFDTITDILEDYYQWRLPFYEKRRQLELEKVAKEVQDITDKVAYINAVINKELVIIKRKKADILVDIKRLNLRPDLYGFTKYYDNETVQKLLEKQTAIRVDFEKLEKMTANDVMREEVLNCMDAYLDVYGDDRV